MDGVDQPRLHCSGLRDRDGLDSEAIGEREVAERGGPSLGSTSIMIKYEEVEPEGGGPKIGYAMTHRGAVTVTNGSAAVPEMAMPSAGNEVGPHQQSSATQTQPGTLTRTTQ